MKLFEQIKKSQVAKHFQILEPAALKLKRRMAQAGLRFVDGQEIAIQGPGANFLAHV